MTTMTCFSRAACVLALCLSLPAHAVIHMGAVGDSLTDEYLAANDMAAVNLAAQSWVQILAHTRAAYLDFGAYKPSPDDNWGGSRDTGYEYNWAKSGAVASDKTYMKIIGLGAMPITMFGSDYASTQANGIVDQVTSGQIDTVFVGAGANDFWFRTNWLDTGGNAAPIDLATLDLPKMVAEVTDGILYAADRQLQASASVRVLVAAVHIREEGQTDPRSLALIAAADTVNTNLATAVAERQAQGKAIAMVDLWQWGGDPLDPHHRHPDGSVTVGDTLVTLSAASGDPAEGDLLPTGSPGASSMLCNANGYCASHQHATHFTTEDGLHPNTLIQALLANEVIRALNTHFAANIPLLTDAELEGLVPPFDTDMDGILNKDDPDDDNDGVPDVTDNCPLSVGLGSDQTDTDGDGQGNLCDSDDDNDGVPDASDAFPLDSSEAVDTDGDGIGDNADTDHDNDGVPDSSDNCPFSLGQGTDQADYDGDGQGNLCDSDDDNDGVPDSSDAFPLDNTESADRDGDGIGDNADTDDDNDGVADSGDNCPRSVGLSSDQTDTDSDGLGNPCDGDDDNDGVLDSKDAFPLIPAVSFDWDRDGAPDRWNTGCGTGCQKNSGLVLDNCLFMSNPDQLNTDGDSQGNACDQDDDNDAVTDAQDNCPLLPNTNQLDTDSDGHGNVCDLFTVLLEQSGKTSWLHAGNSLAFDDFNGDGIQDLLVLAPNASVKDGEGTLAKAGEILIVSGADGSTLRVITGWLAHQRFAAVAVTPDQNSDGVPDIVVGEPLVAVNHPAKGAINRAGRISLLSGADGSWLGTVVEGDRIQGRLGAALAVGDVNGDSKADLVVGAPHAQIAGHYRAGEVIVFNGISNTVLYRRGGDQVDAHFGAAVAVADGQLFVGEPERDTAGGADAGRVTVFDASNGNSAPIVSREGSVAGAQFGAAVAAYGNRWAASADVESAGVVAVYEGSASTPLFELSGNAGDAFGKALAMTDLNGDSKPDLAVGMPRSSTSPQPKEAGRVQVFDGAGW